MNKQNESEITDLALDTQRMGIELLTKIRKKRVEKNVHKQICDLHTKTFSLGKSKKQHFNF